MPDHSFKYPTDFIDDSHQPNTSWGGVPYDVEKHLPLDEPLHLRKSLRPLAKNLRECMKRNGMSRIALAGMMKEMRLVKALRLIDAASQGNIKDTALIRSLFHHLEESEEYFHALMQEEKMFQQLHDEWRLHRSICWSFKIFGPHLVSLLIEDVRDYKPTFGSAYRELCARVAYKISEAATEKEIDPPGPAEVAEAIQKDSTWLPRVAKKYVRAYMYYRMPNEVYLISPNGVILLDGDWRLYLTSKITISKFH